MFSRPQSLNHSIRLYLRGGYLAGDRVDSIYVSLRLSTTRIRRSSVYYVNELGSVCQWMARQVHSGCISIEGRVQYEIGRLWFSVMSAHLILILLARRGYPLAAAPTRNNDLILPVSVHSICSHHPNCKPCMTRRRRTNAVLQSHSPPNVCPQSIWSHYKGVLSGNSTTPSPPAFFSTSSLRFPHFVPCRLH
jgi:hypothetical protein